MFVKKCGECIHAIICKQVNSGWFSPENIAYCKAFKDSANLVEVVRCKDCKYCRTASWGEKYCVRKQIDGVYAELSNLRDDDFCSYGERKDGE